MSEKENIVITGMARTPMGAFQGTLKEASCAELGAASIRAALERSRVGADEVSETIIGCVLPAGQGQAPARQAALGAEMPLSVCCTTVNKMCGSGMKATMLAHDLLLGGEERILVAGGMESMTNAPFLLPRARSGMRLGHGEVIDHMFLDGLEDAYDRGKLMGTFAEATAGRYGFSREVQDEFAIRSLTRAKKAIEEGIFKEEIVPVTIKGRKMDAVVETDETPLKANLEKIPTLKPAFAKDGTVTPANSSSISDGAAALVLMRESTAEKHGIRPIARILGHTEHAHEPAWFTTAPVTAIKNLLEKLEWNAGDVDLYEINEAFAVVTMAAISELELDPEKVNVHGGACALGHPIGASGARIIVTLLAALKHHGQRRGLASLCIGGGEATALAVELVQ